jgi:hypothetical protein
MSSRRQVRLTAVFATARTLAVVAIASLAACNDGESPLAPGATLGATGSE